MVGSKASFDSKMLFLILIVAFFIELNVIPPDPDIKAVLFLNVALVIVNVGANFVVLPTLKRNVPVKDTELETSILVIVNVLLILSK